MSMDRHPDPNALRAWMDAYRLGSGPLRELHRLPGGTQNQMFTFIRAGEAYVLRLAPPGAGERGADTMRREFTILTALDGTGVPHPRCHALETRPEILGSAGYLMARVDGWTATVGAAGGASSDADRHRQGLALVDALVALDTVDHLAVGLRDIGRPDGFLERQARRWLRQLEGYRSYPGYQGPDLPWVAHIVEWLDSHLPEPQPPGILHGDLHLGNVLFRPGHGSVAAFVDWELATVGDPLLDLAQLLVTWPDGHGRSVLGPVATPAVATGWPTGRELVDRYAVRSGRRLTALPWYMVLACFRLAVILEGSHVRASVGLASQQAGDELHQAAIRLLTHAERLSSGRVDGNLTSRGT